MKNISLAKAVLRACAGAGVTEIVLCAGARNAPLVTALTAARGVRTYSFFEERSAAFFALGRMQSSGRPVAVITTSGTAAAELLPAAIEADYQGLPLVLLTADRPRRYRGSGAPQTIVQPGLFSHFVEKSWDIEGGFEGRIEWSGSRPVHVNVCFDEPLLDETIEPWTWPLAPLENSQPPATASANLSPLRFASPLVLVGGLKAADVAKVKVLLETWQRPVYLEAPSQLRGQLPQLEILEAEISHLKFDGVVRIGAVPTVRFWRDLESSDLPVAHFSQLPFSGLPRTPEVSPLQALGGYDFTPWTMPAGMPERRRKLTALLERYPLSEPGWVHWLSRQIPQQARLFLGNSLPVREWDLAAASDSQVEIFANRGVDGIDGLISTFLGMAEPRRSNWAMLGDLTALYDLSGPWALRQRDINDVNLVIINNGGGKIFQRIFHNPLFENPHDLRFGDWARMWNLEYLKLERPQTLARAARPRVLEILPDETQTEAFWREWGKQC